MFKRLILAVFVNILLVFSVHAQSETGESSRNSVVEMLIGENAIVIGNQSGRDGSKKTEEQESQPNQDDATISETTYLPSPYQGYLDTMGGGSNLKLLEEGVTGQTALFYMALTQTEPALAAGLSNANQFAYQIRARAQQDFQLARDKALYSGDQNSKSTLHMLYRCLARNSKGNKIANSENVIELCTSVAVAEQRNPEELSEDDRGLTLEDTFGWSVVHGDEESDN